MALKDRINGRVTLMLGRSALVRGSLGEVGSPVKLRSFYCFLSLVSLLALCAGVSLSGGRSGAASAKPGSGKQPSRMLIPNFVPETGEMTPELEAALNAFGAGRYTDCRKLAEGMLGGGLPLPPEMTAEYVGLIILSHLQQGDFEAAREAAHRLRSVSPEICQDLLAQANRDEQDYNTRITHLQKIVATSKDPEAAAKAQLLTARTHQMFGRMELALESYGKVVTFDPNDISAARALRNAIRLYRKGDRAKEGLAAARYALEKYPDSVYLGEVATNEIIQHFALMETKSDGISYLEQFSHSHEGTEAAAFAVLAAGRLHITSNENALAEETWSKFLADPAHQRAVAIPAIEDELTQLRVHMARAATKDGQHVAAVHSFELALGNPRWSLLCREAGSELADAYEAAGRYDNAVTMLRRLQQNEHGPRAVLSLRFREADALCRGGRTQEALCTYEDVMKAAGGDERLRAACLAGIAFSEGGLAPTR